MNRKTLFASLGVVLAIGMVGVFIAKLSGNPNLTGSVLKAYYVACVEFDAGNDKGTAAGTVAFAFNYDPANLSADNVLGLGPISGGAVGPVEILNADGGTIGAFQILDDIAYTGSDPIAIEPRPIPISVADGTLKEVYCVTTTDRNAPTFTVVSKTDYYDALNSLYSKDTPKIKTFSSAPYSFSVKIGNATMSIGGTAHKTP